MFSHEFDEFDPKFTESLVTRLRSQAWQSAKWGLNQKPSNSDYNQTCTLGMAIFL